MKGKAALPLVFLLLFSGSTLAAPYWLKPGTELVYFANATKPDTYYGGGAYYRSDGCIATLGFQSMRVVFRIINVSNDWAIVNVTVGLYGDKSLRWPYSEVTAYYPANCTLDLPWPVNTITHSLRENVSFEWADYGTELVLNGSYKIHLLTGIVYSMDGRPYGHTLLFGLYPVSNMSYVILDGKHLAFNVIRVLNSTTYVTYYRNFTGPNVFLSSEPVNFTDPSGATSFIRSIVIFNPGDDLTAGFMGVIPDLGASVRLDVIAISDNMMDRLTPKFSGGEVDRAVPAGVLLYNVSVPKTQSDEHVTQQASVPAISGPWIGGVLAGLLLLAGVFLMKRR
ncbi:hypothetical protein [Thermococcus waiotapuensis]|uniref:Uncharacterized protein n=1 Tax=Thermococcus waiotapuensis TaxID=90909 RepID=A0AAE4NW44_9EURY|nr:hypothetical protein [Thermococcus waiotapuensis]MDV3104337.1 hypothetical protein [Thermococcus waiotapuensis]